MTAPADLSTVWEYRRMEKIARQSGLSFEKAMEALMVFRSLSDEGQRLALAIGRWTVANPRGSAMALPDPFPEVLTPVAGAREDYPGLDPEHYWFLGAGGGWQGPYSDADELGAAMGREGRQ